MADKHRSARSAAVGIAGFLVTVIAVNVLLRVVPLPDVDVPSVALPGWLGDAVRIKNWALLALILVVVVGAVVAEVAKERDREGGRTDDDADE
jgi:hypothetical protein